MVKLTRECLYLKMCKTNQLLARKKNETNFDYLNRKTHLYLQSQFIDKIAPMPENQSILVIYLQNNLLQNIQNLESFPNITHLYLQHNNLNKLENLNKLKSLKKLYLGHNEISVVEGLEGLENLRELHLENQRLSQGETLYFDPRTLLELGNSLKILNISNNNITSIFCLSVLVSLTKLIVEDNQLKDIEDVKETLSCLPLLEILNSERNPVTANHKYIDAVVIASKSLKTVNGKNINQQTRTFITNLHYNRENRKKLSELSSRVFSSGKTMLETKKDVHILNNIASNSADKMGSKLFPILKKMSENNPRMKKTFSGISTKKLAPVFKNSLKVSHVCNSASYYF